MNHCSFPGQPHPYQRPPGRPGDRLNVSTLDRDCRCSTVLGVLFLYALILAHSPAFAADRATCSMAVKLLEATDKGLDAVAVGDERSATSGIAVFAQQTQDMADQHSTDDPLPSDVAAALTAILAETASQYFIAAVAPKLLEQALVIQHAMPDICAASKIPDLNRHMN